MSGPVAGAGGQVRTGRAVPDDAVLALLRERLPDQRWFPAKGTAGAVERIAVVDLPPAPGVAADAGVAVGLHLLRLPSGGVLQVPLVVRPDDGAARSGVLGTLPGEDGGRRLVVDGCHDPAFVRAFLADAEHDGPAPRGPVDPPDALRVLGGEQSNTSVLLPALDPPGILKVFRGVSLGANPDVEVPLALHRTGWAGVPRPLAWLTARWPDGDAWSEGHLGVLSELVVGAQDGFELACRLAGAGESFGDLAEDLGRTTAQMHRALRVALPVGAPATDTGDAPPAPPADAARVVATLRARAGAAVAAAPVLAPRAAAVEHVLAAVEHVGPLPPLQRVHGDYHLGQVLRSDARGWSVLDFEGEPQAPREERTRPDLGLRDLAGMLRSVDYAAAVGHAPSPAWAREARGRLVAGYLAEEGGQVDTSGALLRALELDKALYEVVYEARNRPDWLAIPLDGVDRLLAAR